MTDDWKSYQEDVASVFRTLGCSVETNCECVGARTKHLLDVSVRISLFGLSQHWVVECKYWKNKRVSKDKVMTLKSVVDDIGADRGILIAEAGHQSGAHEVTAHTNIMLTSLPELRTSVNATLLALGFSKVRRRNLVMKEEIMGTSKNSCLSRAVRI
jgi:restriction system protein